jgi:hypothetical protein
MIVKKSYLVAVLAVLSAGLAARAAVLQVNATFTQGAFGTGFGESATLNTTVNGVEGTMASVWQFTGATEALVSGGPDSQLYGGINKNVVLPTSAANLEAALGTSFNGVCIDVLHGVNWGTTYSWTVDTLDAMVGQNIPNGTGGNGVIMTSAQADAIAALWQVRYDSTFMSASDAAAFQMAVWDVIYGYNATATTGHSHGTIVDSTGGYSGVCIAADAATAKGWAQTALDTGGDSSNMYVLWGNGNVQDFNFAIVAGGSAVPLPSSVGMGLSMLAGLGCVFGLRKRLQRTV